ncbi:hypothetical protein [Nonomuraea sp. NPDC049400]|uniref:hypothetical protein n=1 Tax=Nonomuraea sp. NPDC049400 TaxID=3364352 RepID=UPI0037A74060
MVGQLPSETGRAACGVVAAVLAALAGAVTAFEALIGFATQIFRVENGQWGQLMIGEAHQPPPSAQTVPGESGS